MSSFLDVSPGDRVLESGAGSGYRAAVLGEMDMEIYSVEIIPELAERATEVLAELEYQSVATRRRFYWHGLFLSYIGY